MKTSKKQEAYGIKGKQEGYKKCIIDFAIISNVFPLLGSKNKSTKKGNRSNFVEYRVSSGAVIF